ncbi:hypothetical protein H1C71_041556, partial [Ictidomys tridecemlineatus]
GVLCWGQYGEPEELGVRRKSFSLYSGVPSLHKLSSLQGGRKTSLLSSFWSHPETPLRLPFSTSITWEEAKTELSMPWTKPNQNVDYQTMESYFRHKRQKGL